MNDGRVIPSIEEIQLALVLKEPFRETKHVHWDFEGGKKPWWYPYGKK
jgi:hypothetical protein